MSRCSSPDALRCVNARDGQPCDCACHTTQTTLTAQQRRWVQQMVLERQTGTLQTYVTSHPEQADAVIAEIQLTRLGEHLSLATHTI